MAFVKQFAGMTTFGGALLLGVSLAAPPAHAAYIETLTQEASDVVATGSGTLDLAGLSLLGSGGTTRALINPSSAFLFTGPASFATVAEYTGFTGPPTFGNGGFTLASSGSGDLVGIDGSLNQLIVPAGYVSDNALSDTSTYDNTTFSMLGVTPGTYTWTWGSGANADSFTLDIGVAAVPEPSSIALLVLPLGLVMWLAARHRPIFTYTDGEPVPAKIGPAAGAMH
jgi:hypothetical protein